MEYINNIKCAKETFEAMVKETPIVLLNDDVNDIRVALERQAPKMPLETQELMEVEWLCPVCRSIVGDCVRIDSYCRSCGQRIL